MHNTPQQWFENRCVALCRHFVPGYLEQRENFSRWFWIAFSSQALSLWLRLQINTECRDSQVCVEGELFITSMFPLLQYIICILAQARGRQKQSFQAPSWKRKPNWCGKRSLPLQLSRIHPAYCFIPHLILFLFTKSEEDEDMSNSFLSPMLLTSTCTDGTGEE